MNRRDFFRKAVAMAAAAVVAPSAASAVKAAPAYGPSKIMLTFRQAWYVQTLRRYNEALALDYAIPFRRFDKDGNVLEETS